MKGTITLIWSIVYAMGLTLQSRNHKPKSYCTYVLLNVFVALLEL